MIQHMLNKETEKSTCKQCGRCCLKGGPALHLQDLDLIKNNTIDLRQVVTIRVGEYAWDQPAGKVLPLEEEILKIKGRDGTWACRFYGHEAHACGIYENRPVECELLDCMNSLPLEKMYKENRLTRADLIPESSPLRELIIDHDEKCSPTAIVALTEKAIDGDEEAAIALRDMAAYDTELRAVIPEKTALDEDSLDFLLGRSVRSLLSALGVKAYETSNGIRLNIPEKKGK